MATPTIKDLDPIEHIGAICFANPFQYWRIELERAALGSSYVELGAAKAFDPGAGPNPNAQPLLAKAESQLTALQTRARAPQTGKPRVGITQKERSAAADLARFILYHRHIEGLTELASLATRSHSSGLLAVPWFDRFEKDTEALLLLGDDRLCPDEDAAMLIALFFQMARAFVNIYANLVGRSPAAIALRASMWQSIFTHDLARYWRTLLSTGFPTNSTSSPTRTLTSDIPTLVTGPSGTGKELVAQAVGRSGFIPFHRKKGGFELNQSSLFMPIHLAALSPSLIESELFGHRRGAFTGALEDRASFLETCASYGTVFLDEIAEIDVTLQVKLLRVLQTREFSRLGEANTRQFAGRLVSATNRDLTSEIEAGRFREDLFYRLNADRLETPSLRDLLQNSSGELEHLVGYVASNLLPVVDGNESETKAFASELCTWIESNLGPEYAWSGNFRELEQCARAVLIRGRYRPQSPSHGSPSLAQQIQDNQLTADQLLNTYCAQVYAVVGTYEGTAKRLGLDRRTVRTRVLAADPPLPPPCD